MFKEVKVFLDPLHKKYLLNMCEQDGLTQAEVLADLIEREALRRKIG
ncbi:replication protein A [Salmonella enterica subsp. enterica serovar Infantis]|nr:replication protein A [Salmonella enterica subsp. enterica serovar Infantis]